MSIYTELTEEFNDGKLRAVISSGQAVVLHKLAIMSKDGDWILRNDQESLEHVLSVLSRRNARYRFGAPLDLRWLEGGWSSHFEFSTGVLRVRTDFVTCPPRMTPEAVRELWNRESAGSVPVVGVRDLCELKKTNRQRDYAVIGELARLLDNPRDELLFSRSARDLIRLASEYPDLVKELSQKRPVLRKARNDIDALEKALDNEQRRLMHANEDRLRIFMTSAAKWKREWPGIEDAIASLPLREAHSLIVREAEKLLPFRPQEVIQS
ncbi:MAG: hypothetical protein R6V03_03235 [Kiritimatiellia bacterium]